MDNDGIRGLVDEATKLRYSRRWILKRGALLGLSAPAIGAVLAATGHPVSAQTPAAASHLKGTKLSFLSGTYFVPAAQDFYTQQIKQFGKENGVDVTSDYVNWPDLQTKIGAAVESKTGPDIMEFWPAWPYLYYENLVEVGDIVAKFEPTQGTFYDWVPKTAAVNGTWYSLPTGTFGSAYAYRVSYFKQAGADTFPTTWEELFKVGKKLKEMGKPLGQAFGHSTGDPPSFAYPYMWAYGAMEVQKDGKTVAFNVPQFVDGMKLFAQGWKDAFDPTGLSWDDSVNNRAFLADQISATLNGSSIYLTAKGPADKGGKPDIAADMNHAAYPKGPAGQFNMLGSHSYGIMKYSKNVEGAKAFLEWWSQPEQFTAWLKAYKGYNQVPGPALAKDPIYTADPKLVPYIDLGTYARNLGYAGPANQKAALASAKYLIVDCFAQVAQGGAPDTFIKRTADQLKRIYEG